MSFIGEIKGINSNVKDDNIAQTEKHRTGYIDANPSKFGEDDPTKHIKTILIINYERNSPLNRRDKIRNEAIKYSKRLQVLVIPTDILLKIFDTVRSNHIFRSELLDFFSNNYGVAFYDKNNKLSIL